MTHRVIRLPNGRSCGLGIYAKSWRQVRDIARSDPRAQIKGFDHFPDDAERVLRQLRFGMHDRINRHLPHYGRGRKWSQDWQRSVIQFAHQANTPRLIVRYCPDAAIKRRLEYRLTGYDE